MNDSVEVSPMLEPETAATRSIQVEISDAEYDGSTHHYHIKTEGEAGPAFVLRRYSQFEALRTEISQQVSLNTVEQGAPWPEKVWWGASQADVVADRRAKLCDWLNALLSLADESVSIPARAFLEQTAEDLAETKKVLARFADPLIAQRLAGCPDDEFTQYTAPHGANGKHFATAKDACMTIELAKQGVAASPGKTVMQLFKMARDINGNSKAIWWEDPDDNMAVREWTWNEYYEDTMAAAKSFIALGVEPFSSVSIIGFNAPQWNMACLGAMACGAKAAGIYATNEPSACEYIVEHSESTVVVVENDAQMAKFTKSGILERLPLLTTLVQYIGNPGEESCGKVKLMSWGDFLKIGMTVPAEKLEERIAAQQPGHCCSLIYTSGTTGNPKAVMISHDNACWTSIAFLSNEPEIAKPGRVHTIVSYLPLSHIAAQALDIIFPIVGASGLGEGESRAFQIETYFARPDALKGSLKTTLNIARPTIFFAVPRVWCVDRTRPSCRLPLSVKSSLFVRCFRLLSTWQGEIL